MEAVHPGILFREELEKRGVTIADAARGMAVPHNRITRLISGEHELSTDMAYRIAFYLGDDPGSWVHRRFDREMSEYESRYVDAVKELVIPWDRIN
jgi:addiction module HigA family antidote